MPKPARSKLAKPSAPAGKRRTIRVFNSFEAAEDWELLYWGKKSWAERLRELESLRRLNYGYGEGRSAPRVQRVLRIAQLGED